MERRAELFETPEIGKDAMFFSLKDITYTPETPKMNEPFTVKGKVELFTIPLVAPIWVIVTAEYPETWWEEIIPIIGAPRERVSDIAIGGNFEATFAGGFQREGEFKLTVGLYAGPTMAIDRLMLPPFPPVATEETTFTVSGKVTPWEVVEEIPGIAASPTTEAEAWEMVEEMLGIAASPTTEVEAWEMVEEIPGIIATPITEVEVWEVVQEIPNIVASPFIEIIGWGVVEEIPGIVARPPMVPAEYTLEITIEPTGTGSVLVEPPFKPAYFPGEVVTLTAYPESGYEFDHWGGWPPYPGVGSTALTIQITMDADWWVVAAFREVKGVSISLVNIPAGATKWQMSVIDWDITEIQNWGTKEQDNIGESAVFDIPPGWSYPLRIIVAIYQKLNDTSRQLYRVQSYRPTHPFTGEPDPTYKEIFIPGPGRYQYNVATELFEKI